MGKRKELPITPEEMVANISAVFENATDAQFDDGMAWYGNANAVACKIAADNDVSVEIAAGVISALSPRTHWSVNVAAAEYVISTNGLYPESQSILHTNHVRALNILRGTHTPDDWQGPKIKAFYANILGDKNAVTIDTWAMVAAFNVSADDGSEEFGMLQVYVKRSGVYDMVADAYRIAARNYGIAPCEMQAIVWVAVRNAGMTDRMNTRLGRN